MMTPRSKNGGLVTTQSASSSGSPASRRSWVKTSTLKTRARACSPLRAGEPGQIGINLDEIGERPRGLSGQRQPDRADNVDDPALGVPAAAARRAASVPTRWPRFG